MTVPAELCIEVMLEALSGPPVRLELGSLQTPGIPIRPCLAGEQLAAGTFKQPLDLGVEFFGLAAVFRAPTTDDAHRP